MFNGNGGGIVKIIRKVIKRVLIFENTTDF